MSKIQQLRECIDNILTTRDEKSRQIEDKFLSIKEILIDIPTDLDVDDQIDLVRILAYRTDENGNNIFHILAKSNILGVMPYFAKLVDLCRNIKVGQYYLAEYADTKNTQGYYPLDYLIQGLQKYLHVVYSSEIDHLGERYSAQDYCNNADLVIEKLKAAMSQDLDTRNGFDRHELEPIFDFKHSCPVNISVVLPFTEDQDYSLLPVVFQQFSKVNIYHPSSDAIADPSVYLNTLQFSKVNIDRPSYKMPDVSAYQNTLDYLLYAKDSVQEDSNNSQMQSLNTLSQCTSETEAPIHGTITSSCYLIDEVD